MSQPLEGIRVLELGSFIAGPFCGMLLGDMGADVIKIERPAQGDQTRAMPPLVNGESASFAALNRRKQNETELLGVVSPVLRARSADDLETVLVEAGVPCSRVNDFQEVFADPHIRARNVIEEVKHPRMGPTRTVRNPVLFEQDSPSIRRPAPLLGEHSAEILQELGYSDVQIEAFSRAGVVLLAQLREE